MEQHQQVLAYHQATKHRFDRFARGPGRLDWATQPEPFRRYHGAPLIELARVVAGDDPPYETAFFAGHVSPERLTHHTISQLFFDSLALSAWKRAGAATWALRVNPSSGNLHPTEGYLICGPVEDLTQTPIVAHYAPRIHALEVRAELPLEVWRDLVGKLPPNVILVGLSSIHWREAWKYGERAFRYCQLDVGHALSAISLAAAGLGWQATLLDDLGTEQVALLLGLPESQGAEAEHPDCLLAVYPQVMLCSQRTLAEHAAAAFADLSWIGQPNRLSPAHVDWPLIDAVAVATEKPATEGVYEQTTELNGFNHIPIQKGANSSTSTGSASLSLRRIIRQRRSAVSMDAQGSISRDAFFQILRKTLAGPGQFPLNALPWRPHVHLLLFVHRIEDLAPGLYLLVRDAGQTEALQTSLKYGFAWDHPPGCPSDLSLYRLATGDVQEAARKLSCQQPLASDGCFSLGMLAELEQSLQRYGPWFYRRLFWECGMIGQVLYLEAEAAGVRGTGIGCFFDDPFHQLLGLKTVQYQSLYHFTVGHPVEDSRLATLPAYPSE
jgi:SagB-type dehydrogenase family enzyme